MSGQAGYDKFRANTPSRFLKWLSRYNIEGEELQNLTQQNPQVVYSEILDLTVAQTFLSPREVNIPGRSISIFGLTSATPYDPVANTGIEVNATTAFVFCRFNIPSNDPRAGTALKHNRGFRGDFTKLYLSWPAQSSVFARLVIFKFDAQAWQSGEAAT